MLPTEKIAVRSDLTRLLLERGHPISNGVGSSSQSQEVPLASSNQAVLKMCFKEKGFVEGGSDSEIVLTVDQQAKKLILKCNAGANFIDVRTAERQARGFPKSGITLKNGTRIGQGFELVIDNDIGPPDRLKHSPREVYVSGYKE